MAPLQNVYYERKVGTAKPCYVCNRPTETVLTTIKSEDFIYTCTSHLSDRGFVTPIAASGPSAEDIRKVISDYNARDARRIAAADKAEGDKKEEEKKTEGDKSKSMLSSLGSAVAGAASSVASAAVSSLSPSASGATSPAAEGSGSGSGSKPASPPASMAGVPSVPAQTHNKYALHRTFFESRKALRISTENAARAKEVSRGMPQVPRGF